MAQALYNKKHFDITNAGFTAIQLAAGNISSWSLRSSTGANFLVRSDPADGTTEDTINGGNEEYCAASYGLIFPPNLPLIYVKSAVANDTLILTYALGSWPGL